MGTVPLLAVGEARDQCPICGSGVAERFELREMLFGSQERFSYLLCDSCGAMRIASPPPDLARHYPAEYYTGYTGQPVTALRSRPSRPGGLKGLAASAVAERFLFGRRRLAARLARRLAPRIPPEVARWRTFTRLTKMRSFDDPVLDVGCGRSARHLLDMKAAGFRRLLGIDPYLDEDCVLDGVPLWRSSIEEVPGTYQVITFNHSFEHVADPRGTLSGAVARLRRGGTLSIRTPIMGGWFWERFGTNWWELDPPRHLFIFSLRSLDLLAKQFGLTRVATIWESSFVEVIASDQITRGIPWRSTRSWQTNPPAGYDDVTIASYKSLVADLNREGRAGRAALYFRREESAAPPTAAR